MAEQKYKNLRQQVRIESQLFLKKIPYLIRLVLAVALIAIILFMTGTVSMVFARRGDYDKASRLIIIPSWIEKYNPDRKAYFEAGKLYQCGKITEAYDALTNIEGVKDADLLKSKCSVEIADSKISSGEFDLAFKYIEKCDIENLYPELIDEYNKICNDLIKYYNTSSLPDKDSRILVLNSIIDKISSVKN